MHTAATQAHEQRPVTVSSLAVTSRALGAWVHSTSHLMLPRAGLQFLACLGELHSLSCTQRKFIAQKGMVIIWPLWHNVAP